MRPPASCGQSSVAVIENVRAEPDRLACGPSRRRQSTARRVPAGGTRATPPRARRRRPATPARARSRLTAPPSGSCRSGSGRPGSLRPASTRARAVPARTPRPHSGCRRRTGGARRRSRPACARPGRDRRPARRPVVQRAAAPSGRVAVGKVGRQIDADARARLRRRGARRRTSRVGRRDGADARRARRRPCKSSRPRCPCTATRRRPACAGAALLAAVAGARERPARRAGRGRRRARFTTRGRAPSQQTRSVSTSAQSRLAVPPPAPSGAGAPAGQSPAATRRPRSRRGQAGRRRRASEVRMRASMSRVRAGGSGAAAPARPTTAAPRASARRAPPAPARRPRRCSRGRTAGRSCGRTPRRRRCSRAAPGVSRTMPREADLADARVLGQPHLRARCRRRLAARPAPGSASAFPSPAGLRSGTASASGRWCRRRRSAGAEVDVEDEAFDQARRCIRRVVRSKSQISPVDARERRRRDVVTDAGREARLAAEPGRGRVQAAQRGPADLVACCSRSSGADGGTTESSCSVASQVASTSCSLPSGWTSTTSSPRYSADAA